MFDKLRNAFSSVVKSFGEKELEEKDIETVLFDLEVALLEADVATEVVDLIKDDLKKKLVGVTVQKDGMEEFVKQNLRDSISKMFDEAGKIDVLSMIQGKKEKGEPYIILFMGINGTGKTTTIAKFANLLRENKFSSVIAAADTFRAGAIEQISEHGKRLNIRVIAQNYGSDPAAVSRDAVLYAKSHKVDCVLIDTAGRMQTSKNLMDQISKINKVVKPDLKIFVGDSLAGNDTVSQAREFYNYTNFDGAILTKSDADARGGAAISIVKVTSSPVLYVGVGQEYKDLKPFNKDLFLESLFGPQEILSEYKLQNNERHQEKMPEVEKSTKETADFPKKETEPMIKSIKLEPEIVTDSDQVPSSLTHDSQANVKEKTEEAESAIEPAKMEQAKMEQAKMEQAKMEQAKMEQAKMEQAKMEQAKMEQAKMKQEEDVQTDDLNDPFVGIETKDIGKYSDMFDVSPPQNDADAKELAKKIQQWINNGRPLPEKGSKQDDDETMEGTENKTSEDNKPKKKRSLFGWMKK